MRNYASPVVDLNYDFAIETGEFRHILQNPDVPAGLVRIIGTAHYVYVPNRPMIETISAEGEVTSRSLLVRSSGVRSDLREATSRFQLRDGNLSLPQLRLYVLGGQFARQRLHSGRSRPAARTDQRLIARHFDCATCRP